MNVSIIFIIIIKDENDNLLADPHNVFRNGGTFFFNQGLNIYEVYRVRLVDINMAEPLVPEPSLVKAEIAIGKLKRYNPPGTDQTSN
jgi:hypothetical protein